MSADHFDLDERVRSWLGDEVADALDLGAIERMMRRAGRLDEAGSPTDEAAWEMAWETLRSQADSLAASRSCEAHPQRQVALPRLGATPDRRTQITPAAVRTPVDLRSASAEELALIPGIGAPSAERLEQAFSKLPPPRTLEEAAAHGAIDLPTARRISAYVVVGSPGEAPAAEPASFCTAARGAAERGQLGALLDELSAHIEATAYWPLDRPNRDPSLPLFDRGRELHRRLFEGGEESLQVAPLWGQSYLRVVLRLLKSAEQRVRVAMFGLCASFNPKLRPLVEAMVDAAERGVDVRVLHDVDEEEADLWADDVAFLVERGVPCRGLDGFHERTVIVDEDLVIGSVGWTAQSVFRSRELSLHLRCPTRSAESVKALDALWSKAAPAEFGGAAGEHAEGQP